MAQTKGQSNARLDLSIRDTHALPASADATGSESQHSLLQFSGGEALSTTNTASGLNLAHQIYRPPSSATISMFSGVLPLTYVSNDELPFEDQM